MPAAAAAKFGSGVGIELKALRGTAPMGLAVGGVGLGGGAAHYPKLI